MFASNFDAFPNFIDAIKYTKSTMVDDYCTAQWSHKFVYLCMCFGGLGVFLAFVIYKNIRPVYLVKKLNGPAGVWNKNLSCSPKD